MYLENTNSPTIEEVIAACKPGVAAEVRASLKTKLHNSFSEDDALQGAIKFLEDSDYDFDALYEFLDMPIGLSAKKVTSRFNYKHVLTVAASVILMIGVWWIFYKKNTESEIRRNVFHEPGLPVFATIEGKKDFHELMSAYRMQDVKTGLKFYYKLIKKEPQNDTLHYWGGWLFFIDKQPDSAVVHFENAVKTINGKYYYKAQYMEAISLYLNKQKSLSKELFKKIKLDKSSPYQKDAIHLLSEPNLW
ncbi:tetratricopeptide repeat protein [Mucilaginibacter dorajii]|uniref:Tetratricopeptide repeat protein n=1 Tax=Mucilaginibacter dorajii TaxID=692994 RepID=A0ABP7P5Z2_9SPHI|nr:hypothetical protein [Mucilaginibacter dorajii]MCS3734550.1 hypothetical protein [Mucilaginibacter dorajii]